MFSTKRMGLILTLALLVMGDACLLAACSRSCCKQTNVQTKEDASGNITACYKYTMLGTSCTTCCGTGSIYGGFCTLYNCDPNQVCVKTTVTYQYNVGESLSDYCSVASEFNEYGDCRNLGSTNLNEPLCTCGPSGSGVTLCNS